MKYFDKFKEKASKVHLNKYEYDEGTYVNNRTRTRIVCPVHGEFWQIPSHHVDGCGCPKCSKKHKYTTEEFIEVAKNRHGDRYDYSKVRYVNASTKVCIVCRKHGEFWQLPSSHLSGKGCIKCGLLSTSKRKRKSLDGFISDAKKVHGEKYSYEKSVYVNTHTPLTIICPIHGEFKQIPCDHLHGCNCPKCKETCLEKAIRKKLIEENIDFEYQKHFKWLGLQSLDFYLPKYNIAIECQGKQHFEPIDFGSKGKEWAEKLYLDNLERDERKRVLCKEHDITLLYYSNLSITYPYQVYEDLEKLFEVIKTS